MSLACELNQNRSLKLFICVFLAEPGEIEGNVCAICKHPSVKIVCSVIDQMIIRTTTQKNYQAGYGLFQVTCKMYGWVVASCLGQLSLNQSFIIL